MMEQHQYEYLNFDYADADVFEILERPHKDLFDRIIIAQAIAHNLTIMTSDSIFKKYPVPVLLME